MSCSQHLRRALTLSRHLFFAGGGTCCCRRRDVETAGDLRAGSSPDSPTCQRSALALVGADQGHSTSCSISRSEGLALQSSLQTAED